MPIWNGFRMDWDFLQGDNSKIRHSNGKSFIETQVIWTFSLKRKGKFSITGSHFTNEWLMDS